MRGNLPLSASRLKTRHGLTFSIAPQNTPTTIPCQPRLRTRLQFFPVNHASGPADILPCQSSQHPPTTSLSITPQYTTTVLPRHSPLSARPQPFPSNHASGPVHGLPLSIMPQDQPTAFPCQSRIRTRPCPPLPPQLLRLAMMDKPLRTRLAERNELNTNTLSSPRQRHPSIPSLTLPASRTSWDVLLRRPRRHGGGRGGWWQLLPGQVLYRSLISVL